MKKLIAAVMAAGLTALSAGVLAQSFPTRPVTLVVPYPPGGVIDIMARLLAPPLRESLGQPVVVENRAGSGGLVGHGVVAKAAPDGHTLVIAAAGPVATSIDLYKSMPYNARTDFAPIGMVGDVDVVFIVGPGIEANSVQDVIQYGKNNPGKLRFGINSVGSLHHLMTEQFVSHHKIDATRVPYKGAGQAIVDLIGGVTHVQIESLPVAAEYIRAKRLKALAVASKERARSLPDVRSFAELGLDTLVAAPWYALLAPAGTPQPVIARLNEALNKALVLPEVQASFEKQGVRAIMTTPEETERFIRSETERWSKIIKDAGVRIEN